MEKENIEEIALAAATPIVFGERETRCFGWFHAAQQPVRGMGVVLCRPAGYEGTCAYETYTQLAEKLSCAGFAVIRFDYHGTGDSAGSDTDPHRVRAWIESTKSAIQEVKRLGGVSRISLFGVRLGATLAAVTAAECNGVDGMVMWAPCVTGKAFARELRASRSRLSASADDSAEEGIEALGYVYTAQTLHDMQSLDCLRLRVAPAKRVLIVGRDDMPMEGPLPAAYRSIGIDTSYAVLPGYANMIVEPHEGVVAHETLSAIVDWLVAAKPDAIPGGLRGQMPATVKAAFSVQVDSVFGSVREIPLMFGDGHSLFGILSEPSQFSLTDRRWETAILMLNVGTNHRVGPNRLYVKMARAWAEQGYSALRFDLAGIGDSSSSVGYARSRLYSKESTVDVRSAIDCLSQRGCKRFIVMGLCSGAYVAFQTALMEPRVSGQILMNPRRLDWKEGETLQSAMQVSYKSTHFYKKALMDLGTYSRIFRGQVDIRGIAGRLIVLLKARLQRTLNNIRHIAPDEGDVLSNAKLISSKGTDTLMIIGAEDDGRDYIEFHLGRCGNKMGRDSHFKMEIVEGSDHTFSNADSQDTVIALVQQHLDHAISKAKFSDGKQLA
jgi:alpha-beta hydrolase superfamily lysophospholipase